MGLADMFSVALLFCRIYATCDKPMIKFNNINSTVEVDENKEISLKFSVEPESCAKECDQERISIGYWKGYDYRKFCTIRRKQELCVKPGNECKCWDNVSTPYEFNRRAQRNYHAQWVFEWECGNTKARKLIDFNIAYPTRILNMTFGSEVVTEEDSVQISCNWENGNPPKTVRIINNIGEVVQNSSGREDSMLYDITPVSRRDTGNWTCEAQGAEENKTAFLNVNYTTNEKVEIEKFSCHLKPMTGAQPTNHPVYHCSGLDSNKEESSWTVTIPQTNISLVNNALHFTLTDGVRCSYDNRCNNFSNETSTDEDRLPPSTATRPLDNSSTPPTVESLILFVIGINVITIFFLIVITVLIIHLVKGQRMRTDRKFYKSQRNIRQRRKQTPYPCKRKPSNHRLALPEVTRKVHFEEQISSMYDLINDDHIVVGHEAVLASVHQSRQERFPPRCLPQSDYLHPIPAPEDLFASHGDHKLTVDITYHNQYQ